MTRPYHIGLVGHAGFHNRGCEAILRSSMSILHDLGLDCRYSLWSYTPVADAGELGGEAITVHDAAGRLSRLDRIVDLLERAPTSLARLAARGLRVAQRACSDRPDAVLSIGGDNFSLDYGPPHEFVRVCRYWMRRKVPIVIWGASVGPFSQDPDRELRMAEFLNEVDLITARESATVAYLSSIGVCRNVKRVWDPAFALDVEPCPCVDPAFFAHDRVLGFNISPLVARWFPRGDMDLMLEQVRLFLSRVQAQGTRILLVPHVTGRAGLSHNNDEEVLARLLAILGGPSSDLMLLPVGLPCRQIKWAISQCRWFIGARTHATIAAVSSCVPTTAIAYSQKARGIWRDIFGHERYLVPIPELSASTLADAFDRILTDEDLIRTVLRDKQGEMLAGARANGLHLQELLACS